MAEKIGLEAVLDTKNFQSGVKTYTSGIDTMVGVTKGADGRLRDAQGRFVSMGGSAASAGKQIKIAGVDISSFNTSIFGTSSAVSDLGKSVLKFGAITAKIVATGVGALGASVAGALVSGVVKAAELDDKLAGIAATMNITKAEAAPLDDLLMNLALDPNLKVTASEAADAVGLLAQNGQTLDQIMNGAARATIALSNATGGSFATSANIAANVANVFGNEIGNVTNAIDGITGVTNQSKFTIDDYALAFAQAGGVSKTVGVSFNDFNTTLAATSSVFASGSDAGTSFKTFLQRLIPQSKAAVDAMRDLGLYTGLSGKEFDSVTDKISKIDARIAKLDPTTKNYTKKVQELTSEKQALQNQLVAGSNAFFDENGQMKSMAQIAGELNRAFSGLSEEQRNEALTTIFGTDAMRTAASLAGYTTAQFSALGDSVNAQGQAFKAAATRVDSLKGAFEIFGGVIEAIQISIGKKFLPVLRKVTVGFTDLASKAAPKIIGFFGKIASLVDTGIAKFEELSGIFSAGGLFGSRAGSFGGGGLLGALGIGAGGQELIGKIIADLRSLGATVQSNVIPAFTQLANQIMPTLNNVLSFANDHWVEIKGAIAGVLAVLGGSAAFVTVTGLVTALLNPITLLIVAAAALGTAWAGNWFGIRDATTQAWAAIKPVVDKLLTTFQSGGLPAVISQSGTLISDALGIAWVSIQSTLSNWGKMFMDWVIDVYPTIPEKLTGLVSSIASWLETQWPVIQGKLNTWGNSFWKWITDVAIPGLDSAMTGLGVAIAAWASSPSAQSSMNELGQGLGKLIFDALGKSFNDEAKGTAVIAALIAILAKSVVLLTGSLIVIGGQIVAGILSGILEQFGVKLQPATFNQLSTILSDIGKNIVIIAKTVGQDIVKGIMDGITSMQTSLDQTMTGFANGIISGVTTPLGINSPSTVAYSWASDTVMGFINGLVASSGGLTSKVSQIFGNIFGGGATATATAPTINLPTIDTATIQAGLTKVQQLISSISSMIPSMVTGFNKFSVDSAKALAVFQKIALSPMNATLTSILYTVIPGIITKMTEFSTKAATAMSTASSSINSTKSSLNSLASAISSVKFSRLADGASDAASDIRSAMSSAAAGVRSLVDSINDATEAFTEAADAAADVKVGSGTGTGTGGTTRSSAVQSSLTGSLSQGFMDLITPKTMTAPAGASTGGVVISINVGDINNGMDLAMLVNQIQKVVGGGIVR